jgi:hypothetical protein
MGFVFTAWAISGKTINNTDKLVENYIHINQIGVYVILFLLSIYTFLTHKKYSENKLYGWIYLITWTMAVVSFLLVMIRGYS